MYKKSVRARAYSLSLPLIYAYIYIETKEYTIQNGKKIGMGIIFVSPVSRCEEQVTTYVAIVLLWIRTHIFINIKQKKEKKFFLSIATTTTTTKEV